MKLPPRIENFMRVIFSSDKEGDKKSIAKQKIKIGKRILSTIAAIAIIGVCGYYLGRNMAPLLKDLSWIKETHWGFILVALVLIVFGNLLGGVLWSYVLRSMNQKAPIKKCIWINTMAILGKYIPGSIWQITGRAVVTSRMDINLKVITSATVLDLALKTLSALLLSAILVPANLIKETLGIPAWLIALIAGGAAIALVAIPYASRLKFICNNQTIGSWLPTIQARDYWLAFFTVVIAWILNSIANAIIVQSIQPLNFSEWLLAAASLPLSMVIGSITPFAPAGLGVREAVLAATLGSIVTPAIASIAAVASRLVLIAGDLVSAAIVAILRKHLAGNLLQITQKD